MKIAVLGGDGVGKELADAVMTCILPHLPVEATEVECGYATFLRSGESISEGALSFVGGCRGILFGATSSPVGPCDGYRSPILLLRRMLDLFVNVRPFKRRIGGAGGLDLVILRENLEGLYAGHEEAIGGERATALKVVTRTNTERLARFAFDYACARKRRKVTLAHKSNVLPASDGLFRDICLRVATEYPGIEVAEQLIDSAAYHIVRRPSMFDIILTMNMYGDILSDVAAAAGDGLGFSPSLSIGPAVALAEPTHGSAPDIAGRGIANPYGMLFSLAMLLEHLGLEREAFALERACNACISSGMLTPDAGGLCSTLEVAGAVEKQLVAGPVECPDSLFEGGRT